LREEAPREHHKIKRSGPICWNFGKENFSRMASGRMSRIFAFHNHVDLCHQFGNPFPVNFLSLAWVFYDQGREGMFWDVEIETRSF
jgi:hypothetical protein